MFLKRLDTSTLEHLLKAPSCFKGWSLSQLSLHSRFLSTLLNFGPVAVPINLHCAWLRRCPRSLQNVEQFLRILPGLCCIYCFQEVRAAAGLSGQVRIGELFVYLFSDKVVAGILLNAVKSMQAVLDISGGSKHWLVWT